MSELLGLSKLQACDWQAKLKSPECFPVLGIFAQSFCRIPRGRASKSQRTVADQLTKPLRYQFEQEVLQSLAEEQALLAPDLRLPWFYNVSYTLTYQNLLFCRVPMFGRLRQERDIHIETTAALEGQSRCDTGEAGCVTCTLLLKSVVRAVVGLSENKGCRILGVLIIRILLFRALLWHCVPLNFPQSPSRMRRSRLPALDSTRLNRACRRPALRLKGHSVCELP